MDPVARSIVTIRAAPAVEERLAALAGDAPIVIDHFASRRCGATVGDLRARLREPRSADELVELEPIGTTRVLAEAALVPLMAAGASLQFARFGVGGPLRIALDRPEAWLTFLEAHPAPRR